MSILSKYINLRNRIKNYKESIIDLENHKVSDSNIYRLHYIDFDKSSNGCVSTQYLSKPFIINYPMNREEVLNVVSYLFNFAHLITGIKRNSFSGTRLVCNLMEMHPEFGFVKLDNVPENEIVDLYVLNGHKKVFKNTRYYNDYFKWYNPESDYDSVKEIYENYNVQLYDDSKKLILD